MSDTPMIDMLAATGPTPEHSDAMMLYGRFVGAWTVENRFRTAEGEWRTVAGRWCFGWILGGRGVQDVLLCPDVDRYPGTTIRCFNPADETWQINWFDPHSGTYVSQIGHRAGDGIVQEGRIRDGRTSRWTFTDITPASFHWQGFLSAGDGEFELTQEMRATRE